MAEARPLRSRLARAAGALAVCALLLGALELLARSQVPKNGLTPFREGSYADLPSELRPGFETRYRGHAVSINSSGFRGPEVGPRQPGVLRVALVGDSFTFGNGVAWEDTLGVRLEGELQRRGRSAQVLNCGVPGYNAEHVALVVRERVLDLDPDVLIYVFFANDIDPGPARVEVPPDARIDPYHGFLLRSALGQWLTVHLKRLLAGAGVDVGRGARRHKRESLEGGGRARIALALDSISESCAQRGVRFLVAVYPFLAPASASPFRDIDDWVLQECAARGLPCVYLLEAFGEEANLYDYWSSVWDSHPNGAGHGLAAGRLATLLLETPR